ncbi:family 2 glycosyl transferase [Flavobacterium enshiense DK69]|uniref:Glycosyl transferase n=1 Tax=Flavobacterium enshiense DK69 TaxID=1107311 RepID=V6S711_9FLAO|nr:glycosyltransferase [Flavobacterium enshiense]ESU22179.1 family 2 glycosyl transferase [Flavobacterium enshiense DK69]KGO97191.1 glycosyl transferase [Flavobacterium enshiense DK69]
MGSNQIKFSILITTKNRLEDLLYTLSKIKYLLEREDTECVICDDGSDDQTYQTIKATFPEIKLLKNKVSKGLIYSRNRLMKASVGDYAISIDDDLHFITSNPFERIEVFFQKHPKCAVQSFRIFWDKNEPERTATTQTSEIVNGYAGGAHVFRRTAWKEIPDYPDWFVFYGEENFASQQLYKKGWEVHYVPEILVNHRVDLKNRIGGTDYRLRQRRALRAGWYLYFMFCPWQFLPKKVVYTLWMQVKTKVIAYRSFFFFTVVLQALWDVFINLPRLMRGSNRFTIEEYEEFIKLPAVKLYWKLDE